MNPLYVLVRQVRVFAYHSDVFLDGSGYGYLLGQAHLAMLSLPEGEVVCFPAFIRGYIKGRWEEMVGKN